MHFTVTKYYNIISKFSKNRQKIQEIVRSSRKAQAR